MVPKAAEAGDANAQFGLGFLYSNGKGVPLDYGEGRLWWTKAAELGMLPLSSGWATGIATAWALKRILKKPCSGTANQPSKDMPRLRLH